MVLPIFLFLHIYFGKQSQRIAFFIAQIKMDLILQYKHNQPFFTVNTGFNKFNFQMPLIAHEIQFLNSLLSLFAKIVRLKQIQMLHRLNYYSRYNRIKSQKQISTLYHLFDDLNIDAIVNDGLIERISALREAHIQQKNQPKKLSIKEQQPTNKAAVYGPSNKMKACLDDQRLESQQQRSYQHTERSNNFKVPQQQMQSQDQKESRSASFCKEKNRTGNISQIRCLQTESIPDSPNQNQKYPGKNSPIYRLKDEASELQNNSKQYIKQSESQIFELDTNIKQQQACVKSSHFCDQFSEGLGQLNKVDEVRKSSCFNNKYDEQYGSNIKAHVQQDYRSEQLERFYGSDIEMDVQHGFQHQTQQNIEPHQHHTHSQAPQIVVQYEATNLQNEATSNQNIQESPSLGQRAFGPPLHEQQEDDDSQPNSEEQQFRKHQMTSIDKRILNKVQDNYDQQGKNKIPSQGLTEGDWPIAETRKSIEGTIQTDFYTLPSTLIPNNQNAEKERKPFKKMIMDRKLNPRLVTSTIVHDTPVKKVNFKKLMKKQSIQNVAKPINMQEKPPAKETQPPGQKRMLLKAFFDQN